MRKILLAVTLATAFVAQASTRPRPIVGGTVTGVNDAGKSFNCHWQTRDWSYQTTPKTAFLVGKKNASFADLKVGDTVQVKYHVAGKDRIADRVIITAQ